MLEWASQDVNIHYLAKSLGLAIGSLCADGSLMGKLSFCTKSEDCNAHFERKRLTFRMCSSMGRDLGCGHPCTLLSLILLIASQCLLPSAIRLMRKPLRHSCYNDFRFILYVICDM